MARACKSCGMGGLEWARVNERWRLVDANGALHSCLNDKAQSFVNITIKPSEVPLVLYAIQEVLPQFKDGTKQKKLMLRLEAELQQWEDENE